MKQERYFTYDCRNEPLFGKFSAHSLSSRLDAIEECILNGKPKNDLLGVAQHHIETTIRYLQNAASNWDSNTIGGSVGEVHRICLAAAHYSHSRLRPAFTAMGLAGHDCYQNYSGYLSIEDLYLEKLFAIEDHWDSPANELRLRTLSDTDDAENEVIEQYRTALSEFAANLMDHLNGMLVELETPT